MTFAEKLRDLRTNNNLTQQELADSIGVSLRTVKSYELNETFPRYRKIYHKIAEKFEIDVNYLLTEGNDFILSAGEKHGYRGSKGAQELIEGAQSLFAGGELSEEDKKVVFDALQEAFFEAKLENKKYTPNKYKKDE